MTAEEIKTFLDTPPLDSEIITQDVKRSGIDKRIRYLPIGVVRDKLDFLCNKEWECGEFIHLFYAIGDKIFCSGSISVKLKISFHIRTLVGAATINVADYEGNEHFAATIKSLCIVNAVSQEYVAFGKGLNDSDFDVVSHGSVLIEKEKEVEVNDEFSKLITKKRKTKDAPTK